MFVKTVSFLLIFLDKVLINILENDCKYFSFTFVTNTNKSVEPLNKKTMMCKVKKRECSSPGRKVYPFIHFLIFFMFFASVAYAQTGEKIVVKGVVKDAAGDPLTGATVAEKGSTNGTMTDIDGGFSLSVASDGILSVTYVGFLSKDVAVKGKATIDIILEEDSQVLDEVVVTALGIKRDRKSLGYALSEVKGDQLTETRDANVANSLSGKVAGLQVKQSGTGAAGSSRIVLRGNNSIDGNNQPLVVVDGIPINSDTGGSEDFWGNQSVDRGSGMADISPDDIASISVLKGPAAAALYGSRAGNGVIMITTKTGAGTSGIGISVNSNLTFDSPMQYPKYQNEYGQGTDGEYVSTAAASWGERMTGQTYKNLIGGDIVYSPADNDLKDFLRTGTTWTNSIELTSANEKNTFRVGVMNLSNKAVVPNSGFNRTSFTLRGTANLTSKLSMDAKISYINQKTDNRVKLAGDPDNIFLNYLRMPRSVHYSDMNQPGAGYAYPEGTESVSGNDLSGKPIAWTDSYSGMIRNPYWAAYKNTNEDRRHRFIGFGSLKYEFTDWLNVQGRYGMDFTTAQYKMRQATGTPYWYQEGEYIINKDQNYEINADFLVTFNKQLSDKLGLVATAGGNVMYKRIDNMMGRTNGLIVKDWFTLANGKVKDVSDYLSRKQINSLYATASFAWDNMLYLDLTARNDWSSSLNSDNNSYFYPSVSGSWLFSETFKELGPINYGKLRLSWAQVGNDTDPYRLYNTRALSTSYIVNERTGQMETILNGDKGDTRMLYDLKNETINSYEVGLELRAFNSRVGLDFAFYNKEAKDQILKMNIPSSTGYSYKYVNAGNVRNRGIELMLTGTPVKTKDFTWDVMLNFSKNSNKIIELADGITEQRLSDISYADMVDIVAREGGSYGDIYGKPYKRNEKGEILLTENGLPEAESNKVKLGNNNPDWMGGITNTFHYKDFDLSFQIDMRYGGEVYMGSIQAGSLAGTLENTLAGRTGMVAPGVDANGNPGKETTAQKYWSSLESIAEAWIYDATNVRLREVSFGYKLPRKLLQKSPLQAVKISFVGRNLWMIHSKTKGFDPEAGFSTGNAQGFEYGSMPTLRSLGFNVNVTF